MAGTEQFDAVLDTPDTRADANGQRAQVEQPSSMSDMQIALERFNAARDARSGAMRHNSYWILGNH